MIPDRRILPILIFLFLCAPVMAGPVIPAEFYGTATINGDPAPAGTVITALINDQAAGSLTTTAPGSYGGPGTFDTRLSITGTGNGQVVRFQINGHTAAQTSTFESGTTKQLALSASYSAGAITTATTAPTASVTTTATAGAEETLVNPWTAVTTPAVTTTTTVKGVSTTATSKITSTKTIAAGQAATPAATGSSSPATAQMTPAKKGTVITAAPTTVMPPATTPESPAPSFETMFLVGIIIAAVAVIRK